MDVSDISSFVYLCVIRCSRLLIAIALQAEPEDTLRPKVDLTVYWLVWQYYENHVARSVDQTSLPLCLFKLTRCGKW